MPVGYLTSSTLIETVKREAMIPTNQSTFTNNDFLAFANQEMRIGLVPALMQYHEEYLVRDSDPVPLVSNQNNYAIPYRAVGGKFRGIFYQDTQGNLLTMTRIDPDNRTYFADSNLQDRFIFFFIQGNEIVLVPEVSENPVGSIIFSYYLRPNELVEETRVGTITTIAIDTGAGTTTVTLDQVPTGFSTTVDFDLLQTRPGHKTIALDVRPSSIDSTNKTMTFDSDDVPSSLIVGDYVAFSGECIIPQVPADLHDVLSQRVVLRCLQALGDKDGYGIAQSKLGEMEQKTGNLVDNRAEGEPIKINNLRGVLRSSKIRNRGWI